MDKVQVQVIFTIEQDGRSYTDALYFDQGTFDSLTPEGLDAMKQARFNQWLESVANPPAPPPPTDPALAVQSIDEQIADLQRQKRQIQADNPGA